MKKIINAIRDFLYNITDYGLIIIVLVIMVSVLTWRFDVLFNKNIEKETIVANLPEIIKQEDKIPNDAESNVPDQTIVDNDNDEVKPSTENNKVMATVEIPAGTYPSKIGDILENSNLINDKNEFLNKSVEMGLDRKLQSGTFEIAVGTSLDEIIKIIAKAN